jgi:hypothetical protein
MPATCGEAPIRVIAAARRSLGRSRIRFFADVWVAGRDELHAAMLDRVMGEVPLEPPEPQRWREPVHALMDETLAARPRHRRAGPPSRNGRVHLRDKFGDKFRRRLRQEREKMCVCRLFLARPRGFEPLTFGSVDRGVGTRYGLVSQIRGPGSPKSRQEIRIAVGRRAPAGLPGGNSRFPRRAGTGPAPSQTPARRPERQPPRTVGDARIGPKSGGAVRGFRRHD